MGYQSFTEFNTRAEAIAAWNKRAPTEELAAKEARIKKLEEALEFYAEPRLYVNVWVHQDLYRYQGKIAREALEKGKR